MIWLFRLFIKNVIPVKYVAGIHKNKIIKYWIPAFAGMTLILFVFLTPLYPNSLSVDVPLHHWTYDIIDRFAARGLIDISGMSSRPLTRMQMAKLSADSIESINKIQDIDEFTVESLEADLDKLVEEYKEEMALLGVETMQVEIPDPKKTVFRVMYPLRLERVGADLSWNDSTPLYNRRGWRLKEGENIRVSVRTWMKIEDILAFSAEPVYYHNKYDSDALFEEGYFKLQYKEVEFAFGRSSMWWGPGYRGSLILSDNIVPLDSVKIKNTKPFYLPGKLKNIGGWDAAYFFSELSSNRIIKNAKLTGYRINLYPLSNLDLGYSKIVMLGGDREGSSLDAGDVFRALFYLNENEASQADNNQISAFDLVYRMNNLGKYLKIIDNLVSYAQYGFDGEEDGGFSNPAYLAGLYSADIFRVPGLSLRSEYANTDTKGSHVWYSHGKYQSGYTHQGSNIGHHMGGDADDLFFRLEKNTFFSNKVSLALEYSRQRRGLSIDNTEIRNRYGMELSLFKTDIVECIFGYFFERIDNLANINDKRASNHIFEISAKVEF